MRDDELTIELGGPHEGMDPRAVADAINAVDKILRNLRGGGPAAPALSDLSTGSARITIRGGSERVELLRSGLGALAESAAVPPGWSPESVVGLLNLHQAANRHGVESIGIAIDDSLDMIDEALVRHAKESIAPSPPSLGSVRGVLYRYHNGGKRSAGLRDSRTERSVEVGFPEHLTGDIRSALDHEVEIWGEVTRDRDDRIRSVEAVGLEVIAESRERVTLDDVAGILGPDWTEGMDPVEWVRRGRE